MKIAFWSPVRESVGVTTNITCIATLSSLAGANRAVLLENHYSGRNIADLVLTQEKSLELREQGHYYTKYGVEYVLKRMYSGQNGSELIRQVAVPLLYEKLLYLPQSYIVNREVFNYEFELVREELFRCLEEMAEYVFVDTETNQNLSSSTILSDADLIVVNLLQEPEMMRDFFHNYPSIREKAVFLFGMYQKDCAWNLRRICYEYHISREQVAAIPLDTELESALMQGRLLQFLNINYYKASGRENDYFMRQAKKAVAMIRENAIRIRRAKLIKDSSIDKSAGFSGGLTGTES